MKCVKLNLIVKCDNIIALIIFPYVKKHISSNVSIIRIVQLINFLGSMEFFHRRFLILISNFMCICMQMKAALIPTKVRWLKRRGG